MQTYAAYLSPLALSAILQLIFLGLKILFIKHLWKLLPLVTQSESRIIYFCLGTENLQLNATHFNSYRRLWNIISDIAKTKIHFQLRPTKWALFDYTSIHLTVGTMLLVFFWVWQEVSVKEKEKLTDKPKYLATQAEKGVVGELKARQSRKANCRLEGQGRPRKVVSHLPAPLFPTPYSHKGMKRYGDLWRSQNKDTITLRSAEDSDELGVCFHFSWHWFHCFMSKIVW